MSDPLDGLPDPDAVAEGLADPLDGLPDPDAEPVVKPDQPLGDFLLRKAETGARTMFAGAAGALAIPEQILAQGLEKVGAGKQWTPFSNAARAHQALSEMEARDAQAYADPSVLRELAGGAVENIPNLGLTLLTGGATAPAQVVVRQGAPRLAATMAEQVAPRVVMGTTAAGVTSAGSQFAQDVDAAPLWKSIPNAVLNGVLEATVERVAGATGVEALFKPSQQTRKNALKVLAHGFQEAGNEGLSELVTQHAQTLGDQAIMGGDEAMRPVVFGGVTMPMWLKEDLLAMGIGSVLGGGSNVGSGAQEMVGQVMQDRAQRQAENRAQKLAAMDLLDPGRAQVRAVEQGDPAQGLLDAIRPRQIQEVINEAGPEFDPRRNFQGGPVGGVLGQEQELGLDEALASLGRPGDDEVAVVLPPRDELAALIQQAVDEQAGGGGDAGNIQGILEGSRSTDLDALERQAVAEIQQQQQQPQEVDDAPGDAKGDAGAVGDVLVSGAPGEAQAAEAQGSRGIALPAEAQGDEAAGAVKKNWQAFPEGSGSLGVPRAEMPQIKSEQRGALANFLRARGIEWTQDEVKPGSLKPTQAEFSLAKVEKARGYDQPSRAILVSEDGHVVDGHHQWLAALNDRPEQPMPVVRLGAPIRTVLEEVRQFPGAGKGTGAPVAQVVRDSRTTDQGATIRESWKVGQQVRWAKGKWKGQIAMVEAVRPDGRLVLRTADGALRGGKEGITQGNVEDVDAQRETSAPAGQPVEPARKPGVDAGGGRVQRTDVARPVVGEPAQRAEGQAQESQPTPDRARVAADGADAVEGREELAAQATAGEESQVAASAEPPERPLPAIGSRVTFQRPGDREKSGTVVRHTDANVAMVKWDGEKKITGSHRAWLVPEKTRENGQERLAGELRTGDAIGKPEARLMPADRDPAVKNQETIFAAQAEAMQGVVAAVKELAGEVKAIRAASMEQVAASSAITGPESAVKSGGAIIIDRMEFTGTNKERDRQATLWAKENLAGKMFVNRDTGWEILVTKGGIDHAMPKLRGPESFEVVRVLGRLLEDGKLIKSEPNTKANKDVAQIHRISSDMVLMGKPTRIKLTVREFWSGDRRFYEYKQVETETPGASTGNSAVEPLGKPSAPGALSADADAQMVSPEEPSGKQEGGGVQRTQPTSTGAAQGISPRQPLKADDATLVGNDESLPGNAGEGNKEGGTQAITDVGEKIGGARKDRIGLADLEAMSDEERQALVSRDAVWPEPDAAEAIAAGQNPVTARMVWQAWSAIAKKPGIDAKAAWDAAQRNEAIRTYVESVGRLRDGLMAARSETDILAVLRKEWPGLYQVGFGGYHGEGATLREKDLARYRIVAKGNVLANAARYEMARKAKKAVAEGWPNKAAWQSRYKVGSALLVQPDETRVEKWYVRARGDEQAYKEMDLRNLWFTSKQEAEAEAGRRYAAITREGRAKEPTRPLNPDLKRRGAERRKGDVKADDFRSAFGFRGVEFGNWANQADRQQAINQAYDGLHDLAELMGIPPRAISLDGALGMAFGARGKGRAAAHYEPGKVVINLTRTQGAGSLAHEWAHAVDNMFGKSGTNGRIDTMASGAPTISQVRSDGKGGIRPEMIEAWRKVRLAMLRNLEGKPTNYLIESRQADGKTRKYWQTPHEMFARAFEVWAAQRLEDQAAASPYLVQGVPIGDTSIETADEWSRRYPLGSEAQRINEAIDGWVATLETEETDQGTRLFQKDATPGGDEERLADRDRVPGEKGPEKRPAADATFESVVQWALRDRARTIETMRKRAASTSSPELAAEFRKTADEYAAVDADDLARHMREFPGHYVRGMSERGGNLAPVAIFRAKESLPPMEARIQPSPMAAVGADGKALTVDLRQALRELADDLRKATKGAPVISVDRGATGEAGGFYDTQSKGVVVKYFNDLDLMAHEVGHWAAENFGMLPGKGDDAPTKALREELARLGVHGSEAKGLKRLQEGLGELVRAWMVNPGEAELKAPHGVALLESKVPPAVQAALRKYGDAVRRFEGADAVQKIMAGQMSTTQAAQDEKRRASAWHLAKSGALGLVGRGDHRTSRAGGVVPKNYAVRPDGSWKLADALRFELSDKESLQADNYLTSLVLAGKDPAAMAPSEHWDYLRKQMRGQAGRVRDMVLHHGLADTDLVIARDEKTGEPLTVGWLVRSFTVTDAAGKESLPQDIERLMDRAHAYGTAQRTLELVERFEKEMDSRVAMFRTLKDGDGQRLDPADREALAGMRRELGSYLGRNQRTEDWKLSPDEFAHKERVALRRRVARLTPAGGGLHNAADVARQALEKLATDPDQVAIKEYLRRYRRWADWNLEYAQKAELLSPEAVAKIRNANEFYIDWHRVFSDDDGAPINIGEAVEGSMRTIHNPLASLLHATWSVVKRGDRNRLMLAYVAPLRLAPRSGSETMARDRLGRQISKEEGQEAFASGRGGYYGGGDQRQKVYRVQKLGPVVDENGEVQVDPATGIPRQEIKTEFWVFATGTEAGLEAMRSGDSDNAWMTFMRGLNQMQRWMIVTSPSFRAKVPIRDNVERFIGTANGNSVQQFFDVARGTVVDPVTGTVEDLGALFALSGASMAGWNQMGHEKALAEVLAEVGRMRQQGWDVVTPAGWWRTWQKLGEKAENIARKAEFAQAFRKGRLGKESGGMGLDRTSAALYAMVQTRGLLDTAESGRLISQLNGFTLFLNAGVKGFERNTLLARSAIKAARRGDMATVRATGGVLLARVAALGLMTAAMRWAFLESAEDDEERKKRLREPAYKRDFAWRMDVPGLGKVAIAKPYEMGWVLSGFERMADAQYAAGKGWKDDEKNAFDGYGKSFVGAVLPIKPDEMMGGSFMPAIEVMLNGNGFTGGSIVPGYESNLDIRLRKGTASASPVGRGVQAASLALGGLLPDGYLKDLVEADARNVDHMVRGYFGSWGGIATSRDGRELWKRSTGISGETSIYSSRDVDWVLRKADAGGVSSRKDIADFRRLLKDANHAKTDQERERLERSAISRAAILRRNMERNPGAWRKAE